MEVLDKYYKDILQKAVKIYEDDNSKELNSILKIILKEYHPDENHSDEDLENPENEKMTQHLTALLTACRNEKNTSDAENLKTLKKIFYDETKQKKIHIGNFENLTEEELQDLFKKNEEMGDITIIDTMNNEYDIYEGDIRLVKGFYCDKIPDVVKIICEKAFWQNPNYEFTPEVIIPSNVKIIGKSAFRHCNLRNVKFEHGINDELILCEGAFAATPIECVKLPVKTRVEDKRGLGKYLRDDNYNAMFGQASEYLTERAEGAASVKFIFTQEHFNSGRSALKVLRLVAVPIEIQLDEVCKISDYAFMNCSTLKCVYINNKSTKLEEIGKAAFCGCENLEKVCDLSEKDEVEDGTCKLAAGINIGERAFDGCKLLDLP